ncbi:MAG TPA: hypothetical protein VGB18_00755 [Candidatus Thermoplasmatota archaeon]
MSEEPERNESKTRPAADGLLSRSGPAVNGTDWMGHLEWGPVLMRNDMGPATVVVTEEDLKREATAIVVQRAVERAIEQGEESEYDD